MGSVRGDRRPFTQEVLGVREQCQGAGLAQGVVATVDGTDPAHSPRGELEREQLGVEAVVDPLFGDIAWLREREAAQARFTQLIDEGGTTVVVSQGTTMDGMIHWLSDNGRLPLPDELETKKGSVWVLSFNNGDLTGADYMASALPLK